MDSVMKGLMGQCPPPTIFGLEPPLVIIKDANTHTTLRYYTTAPGNVICGINIRQDSSATARLRRGAKCVSERIVNFGQYLLTFRTSRCLTFVRAPGESTDCLLQFAMTCP